MITEQPFDAFTGSRSTSSSQSEYNPFEPYGESEYISTISEGKFPVYSITTTSHKYVMKAFPYEYEEPCEGFLNEARFAVLNHKNIIRFHQVKELVETIDTESGDVIKSSQILMEYAPYGDLFDAIFSKGVPFNDKLTRTYFRQFIEGLEYLHQNGIAHLDIKPENLLIDKYGHIKITDFGFAKRIEGNRTFTLCGTPEYLAPEIIKGSKVGYGKSVDWWALGILIFEMLSG
mgnify:CR=1 FL=1